MNILFIIPFFGQPDKSGKIKQIIGFLPYLGVGSLATVLDKAGHKVRILDLQVDNIRTSELITKVKNLKADAICMPMLTPAYAIVRDLCKAIKKEIPEIKIIVGGPHPTTFGSSLLEKDGCFDIAVIGEGEKTIVEIFEALEKNSQLEKVKGIVFRNKQDKIVKTAPRALIEDLNSLPIISRKFFDLDKYKLKPNQYRELPLTNMMTGRGCGYGRCLFCSGMEHNYFRRVTVDRAIEELNYLIADYGIREISFWDNEFVVGKKWIQEFANAVRKEKIDIKWSCCARVNYVNLEILQIMKKAGCWSIFYGIESGNQELLDIIRKGITLQNSRDAIKATDKAGIESRGSFMLGLPGETPKMGKKTIDFACSLPLDYVQFAITTPYPGTPFYPILEKYGKLLKDLEYRNYTCQSVVYLPYGYPDVKTLLDIRKEAYRRFYMRPKYIFSKISDIRSTKDIYRYALGLNYLIKTKLEKQ